jgi:hypothetical protein
MSASKDETVDVAAAVSRFTATLIKLEIMPVVNP